MIAVVAGAAAMVKQPTAATDGRPNGADVSIRGLAKGRFHGPTSLALSGLALEAFVAYIWWPTRPGGPATVTGAVAVTGDALNVVGPLVVVLARSGHTWIESGGGLSDDEVNVTFEVEDSGQYYAYAFRVIDIGENGQTLYLTNYKPVSASEGKGEFFWSWGASKCTKRLRPRAR